MSKSSQTQHISYKFLKHWTRSLHFILHRWSFSLFSLKFWNIHSSLVLYDIGKLNKFWYFFFKFEHIVIVFLSHFWIFWHQFTQNSILDNIFPRNSNFGQHIPTKFKFWTSYPHKIQILDNMSPQNSNFISITINENGNIQSKAKYKFNFKQNTSPISNKHTSPWDTQVYHKFEVRPH